MPTSPLSPGKSGGKGKIKKRDIIPSDFFLDLYSEVEGILQDSTLGPEIPVPDEVVAHDVEKTFNPGKGSGQATTIETPSREQAPSSPWATHPSFAMPLFADGEEPTSPKAASDPGWEEEVDAPDVEEKPARDGFQFGDRVRVVKASRQHGHLGVVTDSDWNGLAKVEMDEDDTTLRNGVAKGKVKCYAPKDLELLEDEAVVEVVMQETPPQSPSPAAQAPAAQASPQMTPKGKGAPGTHQTMLDGVAHSAQMLGSTGYHNQKAVAPAPAPRVQILSWASGPPQQISGISSSPDKNSAPPQQISASSSSPAKSSQRSLPVVGREVQMKNLAVGAKPKNTPPSPKRTPPASPESKPQAGEAWAEDDEECLAAAPAEDSQQASPNNSTFLLPEEYADTNDGQELDATPSPSTGTAPKRTGPPKHKFELRSGERFVDVKATSYDEAMARLRQIFLMKYGSYRSAFAKLEESIDMTGLQDYDGHHVAGMLQFREFVNAVKSTVPNWAEVTGIGNLGKLFKHIDDNDSGFMNFEELFGCKVDDPIANQMYDSCARRPTANRKPRALWSNHQNNTNSALETFQATNAHTNQEHVCKKLAPKFVPMAEYEIHTHHHEEDDGGTSMGSSDHSSDQELDLEHIKLRLRAAGLSEKMNWRKVFEHYDQRHTGIMSWFTFRSIARKEVHIGQAVLTDRDLKELFYCDDHNIQKEAQGDSIHYEVLLSWLEPKPTKEEAAELDRDRRHTAKQVKSRGCHKTAHLRCLEVERRKVAEDHHGHMSCNPCTKLCEQCKHIILCSSWAAHKHGCARKAKMVAQKDKDEISTLAKWNFTPEISARAKAKQPSDIETLHKGGKAVNQYPIRDRRVNESVADYHDKTNRELTFTPAINDRSRDIHRMVHEDQQEYSERLSNRRPMDRMSAKAEAPTSTNTPQITVRGIQKGFERSAENVFHRLHHGPPHKAVFVDPAAEKSEDECVKKTTVTLMKSRKPIGISESAWLRVKQTQQSIHDDLLEKRRQEEVENELNAQSPESQDIGMSPMSLDIFSHSQFVSSELVSPGGGKPLLSARSTAAPSSVGRASVSFSDMPPTSGVATPVESEPVGSGSRKSSSGGVSALSGKLRASLAFTQDQAAELAQGLAAGSPATSSRPNALAGKLRASLAATADSPGASPGDRMSFGCVVNSAVSLNKGMLGFEGGSPASSAAFVLPSARSEEPPSPMIDHMAEAQARLEAEIAWPSKVVTGTPLLMGLLARCETIVKLSVKHDDEGFALENS